MKLVPGSIRILAAADSDPAAGTVKWKPVKSIWIGTMTAVTLIAGPLLFSWSALAVFVVLSATPFAAVIPSACTVASFMAASNARCDLNMFSSSSARSSAWPAHRHDPPARFARLGAAPTRVPRLPLPQAQLWRDAWWQLHCDLELHNGPKLELEPLIASDRFYAWMERTWMWHQLPIALALFALGGWNWVVWGVSVCVTGHWLIGHFAHGEGPQSFLVRGAGVQGFDVPIAAILSMGESWHNNHHAYPGSARIGLLPDQPDPGWGLILVLQRLGLAWNIRTPATMAFRPELQHLDASKSGCPVLRRIRHVVETHGRANDRTRAQRRARHEARAQL